MSYQFDNSGTPGLVNNGTITASQVAFQDSTTNGVQVGQITNTGTMSGQIFFKSSGTIIGGDGTSFGVLNAGTQSGFNGIFSTGSVTFSGNNRMNEGVTTNNGTNNQGTVSNQGILQLAARQTMTGFFSQSAGADLDLVFAGGSFGQYGNLTSTLAASIAGALSLETTGGFSFGYGQTYDVMDFASHSGDFASMALDGVACTSAGADVWSCGGVGFTETFTGTRLSLTTSQVPEPASLAVLGLGVAALTGMRRRRRTIPLA